MKYQFSQTDRIIAENARAFARREREGKVDLAVRWALAQHEYFSGLPAMFFARQIAGGRAVPRSFRQLISIHTNYSLFA